MTDTSQQPVSLRWRRFFLRLLLSLAILWCSGLLVYVAQLQSYTAFETLESVPEAEAIVVLTGGSERVEEGIRLLSESKGKKLLISGVAHGVSLRQVLARSALSDELKQCCVTLGYAADNTIGNALETRAWMEKEGFSSLILVTAHYHMPRSLVFFRKGLPDIRLIPYPVFPDSVKLDSWWQRSGTFSLLVLEYNKYLIAKLRTLFGSFES